MTSDIEDEALMAYADGELEAEAAVRVERAAAADPQLVARIELFRATRAAVAEDARQHSDPPVPPALAARVRELAASDAAGSNVHPFRRVASASGLWRLPVAASIALAIGLGAGLFVGRAPDDTAGLHIAALTDPALETALATVPAGERSLLPNGNEIAAIASFRGGNGELCREFEYDRTGATTVVAVACRETDGWNVRFAVVAAATPETGYAPASSLETLDAYMVSTGAGRPLSLEEEAAELSGLH